MKKAIIFDLYGTLVDIHTDESSPEFWSKFNQYLYKEGLIINQLKDRYESLVAIETKKVKHNFPDIEILKVFESLYLDCKKQVSKATLEKTAQVFRQLSLKHISLYPGAISLLTSLRNSGYTIVLLSNAQQVFTNYELDLLGLRPYFDKIYLSSDYGVCKPNPLYFKYMLKDLDLQADACIYIGNDHIADVAGAKAVGMEVIYLHTNCSQEVLPEFKCLLKVIPGNLSVVEAYIKKEITK